MPWPADVAAATLPTRYQTGYNVMATSTAPPYTTITAYDLNTGDIKWQVPNGDDPDTIAAGGPSNTGGIGARNGMVVTSAGLLFQLSKDGFARAYDVDTGQVLWKGKVAGQSIGIPTMYMSKGRQYVVFMSPQAAAAWPPDGQMARRLRRSGPPAAWIHRLCAAAAVAPRRSAGLEFSGGRRSRAARSQGDTMARRTTAVALSAVAARRCRWSQRADANVRARLDLQRRRSAGLQQVGQATWRAENGEIIGTPTGPEGGWLLLGTGYQDVQFAV